MFQFSLRIIFKNTNIKFHLPFILMKIDSFFICYSWILFRSLKKVNKWSELAISLEAVFIILENRFIPFIIFLWYFYIVHFEIFCLKIFCFFSACKCIFMIFFVMIYCISFLQLLSFKIPNFEKSWKNSTWISNYLSSRFTSF